MSTSFTSHIVYITSIHLFQVGASPILPSSNLQYLVKLRVTPSITSTVPNSFHTWTFLFYNYNQTFITLQIKKIRRSKNSFRSWPNEEEEEEEKRVVVFTIKYIRKKILPKWTWARSAGFLLDSSSTLKTEVVCSSEMWGCHQTTWHYNLDDYNSVFQHPVANL